MHDMVKKIVEQKTLEKEKEKQQEKERFLLANGLCEKIYSPYDYYSDEYPEMEIATDSTGRQTTVRYYGMKAITISDEDYEIVKNLLPTEHTYNKRIVKGQGFLVLAIITYTLGFILGMIFGFKTEVLGFSISVPVFSFEAVLPYWAQAFFGGTLFLGISKIIALLAQEKDKG